MSPFSPESDLDITSGETSGVFIVWISRIQDLSLLQIAHAAIYLCSRSEQEMCSALSQLCQGQFCPHLTDMSAVLRHREWIFSYSVTSIWTTHKEQPHIHLASMV